MDPAIFSKYEQSAFPEISGHTFYAPVLGPDSVVIDLGASSANFSHVVARLYGARCHAVEATSHNVALIEESDRVRKYHFAIGGADGPTALRLPESEEHWGTVLPAAGSETSAGEMETVPGITLGSFLASIGVERVDLMKVDIEGAEIAMFDAAPDDLLTAIGQITIEFHDFMELSLAGDVRRVIDRLRGLGFIHVVFTRHFHGDVLFINPARVKLPVWTQLWMMGPLK